MTRTRIGLGATGVVIGGYGAFLFLSRGREHLEVLMWLAAGVALHDGVLAVAVLALAAVAFRVVPEVARAPVAVGFVVLGTLTLVALPVLGRFGERADNPTLLPRDYTAAWVLVAALTLVAVLAASFIRARRR
ncbi:hypothetical protein [Nocardioides sp.]|uniref:hypothetical protein n=1 Tax=Nocardioides sp. TaxID=35761 RepID=UPI00356B0550